MSNRDELARQALALPPDDRAFLADVLEQSLAEAIVTPQMALAWTKEIDNRLEAYDRGEIQAVEIQTAKDEMRRELAERRAEAKN